MKKILLPFIFLSICACSDEQDDSPQIMTSVVSVTIDGELFTMDEQDIVSMSLVDGHKLMFSVMSEQNDIQVGLAVHVASLQSGSYSVYDCYLPSECSQEEDDKNQFFVYGPFPKTPPPPASDYRSAVNAPTLDLFPGTFEITDVKEEQLEGSPWPTKRIKGHFEGTLGYIEDVGETWQVVGKKIFVEGDFEVFCNIL